MGAERLSTLSSPTDKCILWSKPELGCAIISPALRNPKKHMVATAQSIVTSLSDLSTHQEWCIWANRYKVIGSLLGDGPLPSLFTQWITYSSWLISSMWGLPRPTLFLHGEYSQDSSWLYQLWALPCTSMPQNESAHLHLLEMVDWHFATHKMRYIYWYQSCIPLDSL